MKTQEFRKLVREEVKKTLNEATFKLQPGFSITHLKGKSYAFEYSKYDMEPTATQVSQIAALVRKEFAKIADKVQAGSAKGEATVYVRDGNVTIGVSFTSKLGADQMDAIVPGGIKYVD
jgi:hypothetical protein